jgi:hypothetical protein
MEIKTTGRKVGVPGIDILKFQRNFEENTKAAQRKLTAILSTTYI